MSNICRLCVIFSNVCNCNVLLLLIIIRFYIINLEKMSNGKNVEKHPRPCVPVRVHLPMSRTWTWADFSHFLTFSTFLTIFVITIHIVSNGIFKKYMNINVNMIIISIYTYVHISSNKKPKIFSHIFSFHISIRHFVPFDLFFI
jgi:hypothetical protein